MVQRPLNCVGQKAIRQWLYVSGEGEAAAGGETVVGGETVAGGAAAAGRHFV